MVAPKPYRNHNKDEFRWKGNTVVKVKRSTDSNITFEDGVWDIENFWNDKNIWREYSNTPSEKSVWDSKGFWDDENIWRE